MAKRICDAKVPCLKRADVGSLLDVLPTDVLCIILSEAIIEEPRGHFVGGFCATIFWSIFRTCRRFRRLVVDCRTILGAMKRPDIERQLAHHALRTRFWAEGVIAKMLDNMSDTGLDGLRDDGVIFVAVNWGNVAFLRQWLCHRRALATPRVHNYDKWHREPAECLFTGNILTYSHVVARHPSLAQEILEASLFLAERLPSALFRCVRDEEVLLDIVSSRVSPENTCSFVAFLEQVIQRRLFVVDDMHHISCIWNYIGWQSNAPIEFVILLAQAVGAANFLCHIRRQVCQRFPLSYQVKQLLPLSNRSPVIQTVLETIGPVESGLQTNLEEE